MPQVEDLIFEGLLGKRSDAEIQAISTRQAEDSFREFVRQAWPIIEPAQAYVPTWHIDAICDHLQACTTAPKQQIQRLIINVPPGAAKSILCCVFFHAWLWARKPSLRFIFGSYKEDFAFRDANRARDLIQSDWYRARWGSKFSLLAGANAAGRYTNDKTGYRISAGVSSGIGERMDVCVWDDPHSPDDIGNPVMEKVVARWRDTMSTRANDIRTAVWLIVMQRLHEKDVCGEMIEQGNYYHLCLPMRYDGERSKTCLQFSDPRKKEGDLIFPARWPESEIQQLEKTMGPYSVAAQFAQRPAPAGGGILKQHWWKYWKHPGQTVPPVKVKTSTGDVLIEAIDLPPLTKKYQSWDLTFKDSKHSDYVVGQVWGENMADRFLLDQTRDRMDFPTTKQAIRDLSVKHPTAMVKLVEDKANGPAIMAELKSEIAGMVAVDPKGGKVARAFAVTAQIASGNVYLPHPDNADWVNGLITEATQFPNGAHDDQVDTLTQALSKSEKSGLIFPMNVEDVLVAPFDIPVNWPRAYALISDHGWTGAIWGAWDKSNNVVYFYAEYLAQSLNMDMHVSVIARKGKWIPGVVSASGTRVVAERQQMMRRYRGLGLKISEAPGTETAMKMTWTGIQAGELKVFSTLGKWIEQFRLFRTNDTGYVVRENAQLQIAGCDLFGGGGKEKMIVEPKRGAPVKDPVVGERGWMA